MVRRHSLVRALHKIGRQKLTKSLRDRRDRRKLTFYFIAERRIDFRELVRELFRCASPPPPALL